MSFKDWIATARITDDPEGDFVEDMRSDIRNAKTSADFSDIAHLRRYLLLRGACQGAMEAVPGVWRRYRRSQIGRTRAATLATRGTPGR